LHHCREKTWNDYVSLITHADGSRGGMLFSGMFVCLSVCSFICLSVFPHDISKAAAARIAKLDVEMFHHECWKPIYFGVKGQGHDAQKQVCDRLQPE